MNKKINYLGIRAVLGVFLLCAGIKGLFAQAKISATAGATPVAGAILEIESTDKGMLLPRISLSALTTWSLAGTATNGMLIYNTNTVLGTGIYIWNNSQWQKMQSESSLVPSILPMEPLIADRMSPKMSQLGPLMGPGVLHGSTSTIMGTDGITYTMVRAKDGNAWLQQNLGAPAVAANANDANAFGHYYQWGRWNDGHQKPDSYTAASPTVNNPAGVAVHYRAPFYSSGSPWWSAGTASDTWTATKLSEITATNGCDPCKIILGGNWRLPTEAEYTQLITSEGLTTQNAFSSNLKFSFSGRRLPSGVMDFTGSFFWTRDVATAGSGRSMRISNVINNGIVLQKATGLPIRCVRLP